MTQRPSEPMRRQSWFRVDGVLTGIGLAQPCFVRPSEKRGIWKWVDWNPMFDPYPTEFFN